MWVLQISYMYNKNEARHKMKLFKKLLPFFALTSITAASIPLVSCGDKNNTSSETEEEYNPEIGPYVPQIEALDEDTKSADQLNTLYFNDASVQPKIIVEDYLWSEYGQTQNDSLISSKVNVYKVNKDTHKVWMSVETITESGGKQNTYNYEFIDYEFKVSFVHNKAWLFPDPNQVYRDGDWAIKLNEASESSILINKDSEETYKETGSLVCCTTRLQSHYLSKIHNTEPEVIMGEIGYQNEPTIGDNPNIIYEIEQIEDLYKGVYYTGQINISTEDNIDAETWGHLKLDVDGNEYEQDGATWFGFGSGGGSPDVGYFYSLTFTIFDEDIIVPNKVKIVSHTNLAE